MHERLGRKGRWMTIFLVVGIVLLGAVSAWTATLEVGPGEAYTTIQAAIDAATPGDTINVAAGVYVENVLFNKRVSVIGAGSDPGGTVIRQTQAGAGDSRIGVVQLNASGLAVDPIVLRGLRIEPVGLAGLSVGRFCESTGTSVSNLSLYDLQVIGTNNMASSEQERGLYVDKTSSLINLVVMNCAFDNLSYGWYFHKDVSAETSIVTNITVTGTTFNHNNLKGIYAEKLDSAYFLNVMASENGFSATGVPSWFLPWMAGIDVNLKAGIYTNLTFENCTVTNNGLGGAVNGVGLTVKGRGSGDNPSGSYTTFPALVSGVSIIGGTYTGNVAGIRIGEPGMGNATPIDVVLSGTIDVSGNTSGTNFLNVLSHMTPVIDATAVTFVGATDPFAIEDLIHHALDDSALGLVVWNPDNVYVTPNSGSIQRGVDAVSDSWTVNVASGTYVEQPWIAPGSRIVLEGEDRDTTVLSGVLSAMGKGYTGSNTVISLRDMTFEVYYYDKAIYGVKICKYAAAPLHLEISGSRFVGDWGAIWLCRNSYAARDPVTSAGPVLIYNNQIESPKGMCMSNSQAYDVIGNTFDLAANPSGAGGVYIGSGCGAGGSLTRGDHHFQLNDFQGADGGWAAVTFSYFSNPAGAVNLPNTVEYNTFWNNDVAIKYDMKEPSMVSLGDQVHFNTLDGNGMGILVVGQYADSVALDAILNWWGDASGPSGEGPGTGDSVSTNVIYSPWLGIDPDGDPTSVGVQINAPMLIVVAPVGPAPTAGYLNTAIAGANSPDLPYSDTIKVNHGTYTATTPITQPVNIVSETGSAAHTTLNGNMSINGDGVLIGLPLQGFRVNGNLTVGADANAATSSINWCDVYGSMTNNGTGTFDAQYNYWGTLLESVVDARTTGLIDYDPFLPKNADDSYVDATAIINAGLASGMDPAIDQLWLMVQLGQDVSTFIGYAGVAGAGAFAGAPAGAAINLGGAAGGGGAVEGAISGTYTPGDPIDGRFTLTDPVTGEPITDAAVTTSLLGPDGALVFWGCATYDETTGEYVFTIDTSGLAPGTYELIIQTDDGQSKTVSIEVLAA